MPRPPLRDAPPLLVEFVIDEAGVTQVMGSGLQQMLARLEPKH